MFFAQNMDRFKFRWSKNRKKIRENSFLGFDPRGWVKTPGESIGIIPGALRAIFDIDRTVFLNLDIFLTNDLHAF